MLVNDRNIFDKWYLECKDVQEYKNSGRKGVPAPTEKCTGEEIEAVTSR